MEINMKIYKVHAYGVVTDLLKNRRSTAPSKEKSKRKKSSNFDKFLYKYVNIEDEIDNLNSIDLAYYFREVANENGYKYVISNIKKDAHIFKELSKNFSKREICGMITFLYESTQNYLDKKRLSPNVLASAWINTIYADFNLWLDDKYKPSSKKKNKEREWNDSTENKVEIGLKI